MPDRRGIALLEALVALAVVAIAGLALLGATTQAMGVVSRSDVAEESMARAEQVLTIASLWSRETLDRRLGQGRQGGFRLTVGRPRPGLYRLAIVDPEAPGRELLVTVVAR